MDFAFQILVGISLYTDRSHVALCAKEMVAGLDVLCINGFDKNKILNIIKKYKKIIFYERVYKTGTLYNSCNDFHLLIEN